MQKIKQDNLIESDMGLDNYYRLASEERIVLER